MRTLIVAGLMLASWAYPKEKEKKSNAAQMVDSGSFGIFVNGTRVEGKVLSDGDEIVVGRYRLTFLTVSARSDSASEAPLYEVSEPGSLQASS